MKAIYKWMIFGALSALSIASMAGGDIQTCYDSKITAPRTLPGTEIFVVIDQTTMLDGNLKQMVADQIRPFLSPGNSFSVLVFSAYTQGKYTQLLTSGQLDVPIPTGQRNDISKPVLAKFDQCMARQPAIAAQAIGGALRIAFDGTSGDITKSDIWASLKDISGKVRQSTASQTVVLLVSDMLENSSVTSFYSNQSVRKIDPAKELQLAVGNQLLGDFGGSRLYVMGAGLLNNMDPKSKAQYRDPKTMQALSIFWSDYFDKSKAQLLEFGMPSLLNQIK